MTRTRNSKPGTRNHPASSIQHPQTYTPLTLSHLIRQRQHLPVGEVIELGIGLARALEFLHERGLVHRDIKPGNIIFVDGVPKLADVGLVALAESARTFVGTEGFVPPEGPGTVKADIYSLGKCIYEMAMGKDRQAFPSPPTLLDELPDRAELLELNEVITRACDPDPKQRYATAEAMLADLQLLQRGDSVRRTHARRKQVLIVAKTAAVVGLCAIAAGAFWAVNYRPKPRVLLQDDFDGAGFQPDTNFWTWSHADWGPPDKGRRTFNVEQSGGELVIRATADHEDGLAAAECGWVNLKPDLRQFGSSRVEIPLSGTAREGSLTVALSAGAPPQDLVDSGDVQLARHLVRTAPVLSRLSKAWDATTMRIDLLPQAKAAIVHPNTNRLDEFDVVDLRDLPKWHLRFLCYVTTSRGLAGGLAELRIKRVVVYRRPQPDCLLGRVVEEPSNRPVENAVIKDSSGKTLAKTLANGAFMASYVPNNGPLMVEKAGYALVGGQTPGATKARTFVNVRLRKLNAEFGDVVGVIACGDLAVNSIGLRAGSLNLHVCDLPDGCRLAPVDRTGRILGPVDSWKLGAAKQHPGRFAECGERLVGFGRWPGMLFNLLKNPLQEVLKLEHPDDHTPLSWPEGCAFDGKLLWFVERDGMNDRFGLHALDLDCLVITNSLKSVDRGISGLAWDGRQFWVSSAEGRVYAVNREAALRHGTVEMGIGREFKGQYQDLAFGQGYLWGLEADGRRICKIKITD